MSAITNVWRQLVQRRLWPVAILLIAALAGVPLALTQDSEAPAPPAPVATADGETALAVQPIVAQASAADRGKRRKVLGTSKNPFGLPKEKDSGSATPASSDGATTAKEPATTTVTGGSAPSTGDPAPVGGTYPPSVTPSPGPVQRRYSMYELTVRFGESESGGARKSVERLEPLPSTEEPVLIYLGVLKDGETAVFLVDKDVSAIGDGQCQPTPDECETVRLRAGETEFFDVVDEDGNVSAQYQLDLLKIHKSSTTSASRAQASSKAGKRLVKARVASDGPTGYRWDASAGTLERRHVGRLVATVASQTVSLP